MDKALVLTHPFERFQADEEEIEQYLEDEEVFDDVYYIGQGRGRRPRRGMGKRSRLPPGFSEGYFEEGIYELEWGKVNSYRADVMTREYDEIGVGGAMRDACVSNTVDTLLEGGGDADVYVLDEVTYP